ncbi:MAG: helicase-exonuclease AddAB subunit AddB [Lachnospiraceae bacterium]|nr:helicase-exonuclease AddAB subunit AddB [Lachnospiraceae bacterium]
MSLRFYFGPSGVGKSRQLYEEIIRRSQEAPKTNFLVIVPDQFTMQTQKELVTHHDRGGIMNIDVLSFGRLSHRILEEVGRKELPVLDDTGKSLVLQKVAGNLKDDLPTLGSFLSKQGYIHEVKSAISEFMQYSIGTEDMKTLIAYSEKRGALVQKLKDLETLYKGFTEYIKDNYITTEETLDVVRRSLEKSKIIPGSVIVLDGFTGFTPIQERLIQELMRLCEEMIVTVTIGEGENPYEPDGEQKLFHLSKKTVAGLIRLAKDADVSRGEDVFLTPEMVDKHRFCLAPALLHLEQGLFRYGSKPFEGEQTSIRLSEMVTPADEVHQTGLTICRLVREQGMAYRDMAVILGDQESYAPYIEREFEQLGIPCFLDCTRGIVLNPMVEYIKSAVELYLQDFSYESVFHYLRSGLSDLSLGEVDELENYVLRTGIRGKRKWSRLFTAKAGMEQEDTLARINSIRERFVGQIAMLDGAMKAPAKEFVERLYDFLCDNRVQEKLAEYEAYFHQLNDLSKEREYAQIYRLIMELLEQIHGLLGEEVITLKEFADILEAGFGEIQVGTIPQNVDRVVVGDMERTRLKQVKVLFFLGINDGNIPKSTSKGGILSDMDREFLQESNLELAPTPRQQMYIQRFYLYLNMTKPSEQLYLSYSKIDSKGKSIRPAYLVDVVQKLFPDLQVEYPQNMDVLEQMVTPREGVRYLSEMLRDYITGVIPKEQQQTFFSVYQAYGESPVLPVRELMTEAAFKRYLDSGLAKAVARALYGKNLENSVTRLETFAACAYRHFLQYGLSLKERQEFGFEAVDMGNVYHGVLEVFARKLAESTYTWFDFSMEFARKTVEEALEEYAATYGETVLYSSARNEYAITRMERILTRTVLTLQNQLQKGSFQPENYEVSFRFAQDLESIRIALSEDEKMYLRGRIDRVDILEDEEKVYVKVIDYKSGNKQFQLGALYYGLQLQLVVYMNAAMELQAKKHPGKEVVPAALLYYHIQDPTIETAVELSPEEIEEQILGQLRMNGVVNAQPDIVERLDHYMQDKSAVIPVEKKKDGTFSARSGIMSSEELKIVSDYVNHKVRSIGREILDGNISINPYQKGQESACTYCAYKKVCGFEGTIPGYQMRELEEMDQAEIMMRMKEVCEGADKVRN